MRPYLRNTVLSKAKDLTLKRVTQTIVNYQPVESEVESTIKGQLKPLKLQDIVKDEINYHLRYKFYTGIDEVLINDYIEDKGVSYRCYAPANYSDYGFYKAYLEEVKE